MSKHRSFPNSNQLVTGTLTADMNDHLPYEVSSLLWDGCLLLLADVILPVLFCVIFLIVSPSLLSNH